MQHCLNPSSLSSAGHKLKRVSRADLKLVLRRAVSDDFRYLCARVPPASHCIAEGKSVQHGVERFYLIAVRLNFAVLNFNV